MTNTLIIASAGTGKTYTLTNTIKDALLGRGDWQGAPVPVAGLVATTFTRKAAADLTKEIRKQLLESVSGEVDEELAREVQSIAGALDAALVGTVNSVAGSIVGDFAIDAGLSPQIEVLDEESERALFQLALEEAVGDVQREHRNLLLRTGLLGDATGGSAGQQYGGSADWKDAVGDVANAARSNGISGPELKKMGARSWERVERDLEQALGGQSVDGRADWLGSLEAAVEALGQRYLEESAKEGAGAGHAKSLQCLGDDIPKVQAMVDSIRLTSDPTNDTYPWADWLRIMAGVAPSGLRVWAKSTLAVELEPHRTDLAGIFRNSAWHDDLRSVTKIVFDTAAQALEIYQDEKRALGAIDFKDQELLALDLLRTNNRVAQDFASRYSLLAVDEFQDTSPIQLALFTKMRDLISQGAPGLLEPSGVPASLVWVGDPKQSIYGFRDAAPELLDAIENEAEEWGFGTSKTLSESWRSNQPVIDLSNAIFDRVFDDRPVVLSIPDKRKEDHGQAVNDGHIEVWKGAGAVKDLAAVVANGVNDLLKRENLAHKDVAVLVRSKAYAGAISAALDELGIPSTQAATLAVETPAGRMVVAGLGLLANPRDYLALVTLIQAIPEHQAQKTWFQELAAAAAKDNQEEREQADAEEQGRSVWVNRRALYDKWREDPTLKALLELRYSVAAVDPVQTVEAVITALGLPQRVLGWLDPAGHLLVLDTLVAGADSYSETLSVRNSVYTLEGLAQYMTAWDGTVKRTDDKNAVFVDTIHQAKGLEWPAVITVLEAKDRKAVPGGLYVHSKSDPDPQNPLADREVMWVPPFVPTYVNQQKMVDPLLAALEDKADKPLWFMEKHRQERQEEARLLYVAFTRSAKITVLVPIVKDLDEGSDLFRGTPISESVSGSVIKGVLKSAHEEEAEEGLFGRGVAEAGEPAALMIEVEGEEPSDAIDVEVFDYSVSGEGSSPEVQERWVLPLDAGVDVPRKYPDARLVPSGRTGGKGKVEHFAVVGPAFLETKGRTWEGLVNDFGDAVHSYLSLPEEVVMGPAATQVAGAILKRWGPAAGFPGVGAEDLVEMGKRWHKWVRTWALDGRSDGEGG